MDLEWNDAQRERLREQVVDQRPADTDAATAEAWLAEALESGPYGYAGDDEIALVQLGGSQAAEYARAMGVPASFTIYAVMDEVLGNDALSESEKTLEVATRLLHGLLHARGAHGEGPTDAARPLIVAACDAATELGVAWRDQVD